MSTAESITHHPAAAISRQGQLEFVDSSCARAGIDRVAAHELHVAADEAYHEPGQRGGNHVTLVEHL